LLHFEQAIAIRLGDGKAEWDMNDIDLQSQESPSTLGTGGGTDYDDQVIRARPSYKWEMLMSSPATECFRAIKWFASKLGVWFGLSPLWRRNFSMKGLSLDVRLDEKGRYVPFETYKGKGKSVDRLK
jgi:hypothetical protein